MFNIEIHDHLLALGFAWTPHEAEVQDHGNGETGPMVHWCPPWDEYVADDWRVIIDQNGHVVVSEARDLAFEAWCDEMSAQAESEADVLVLGYSW